MIDITGQERWVFVGSGLVSRICDSVRVDAWDVSCGVSALLNRMIR